MIRSFHRAFNSELTLHSLGGNLQLYRPLPARRVFWTAGFIAGVWILVHVLAVRMVMLTLPWAFAYLAIPLTFGWLASAGK